MGKLHQLHFLKLMLTDNSADILPIRSGFAAKTGSVRGQANWQARRIQNFVAIKIRHRHLGRRNQPKIFLAVRYTKRILREFRKLACPIHRFGIHQVRWKHFGVSVLSGVQIEHEVGEGPLQSGT